MESDEKGESDYFSFLVVREIFSQTIHRVRLILRLQGAGVSRLRVFLYEVFDFYYLNYIHADQDYHEMMADLSEILLTRKMGR